jgi:succinate dehydrogenase/fumarate reductase flavoprotein subunit
MPMTSPPRVARTAAFDLSSDVLVLGGGPAGTWAALRAAEAGAKVVLADKGFCGSSGATAASGTQIWYIDPDPAERETAMASREAMGGFLADRSWMTRVLDTTYAAVNRLGDWGYPFPVDATGVEQRLSVQGPEYMRLMRRRIKSAGVRILDQSPAVELLLDGDGRVAGARGWRRQEEAAWQVAARAVVIATGGCAFLSKALGCDVLTGDGQLMAAEAGADLSGMEFSNAYAIAPEFGSVTKTALYNWATFTFADGTPIPGAGSQRGRSVIARTLLDQQVFCRLDKADEATRAAMRLAQPNFFLPYDRRGIDPFVDRFPVTLRLEGTVRGTGGLRVVDERCATAVEGLFAAGDAATRELICGGFTGGGSHNAAWAIASGHYAGEAAAALALSRPATGGTRLAGASAGRGYDGAAGDARAMIASVQAEVFPYDRNYFRSGDRLLGSLQRLDRLWDTVRMQSPADPAEEPRWREAMAMVATSRWMYRAALARAESRGMHRREDFSAQDPGQHHYLTVAGLDAVTVAPRPAPTRSLELAA